MGEARVIRADRSQLQWDLLDLEGLLPADHRARIVWSFVEGLDLSPLYASIKSREGEAGRPCADPAVCRFGLKARRARQLSEVSEFSPNFF
jgi:hypothetical protein